MSAQSRADQLQQNAEAEEDEAKRSGLALGRRRRFSEFDCPICSANNPHDAFGNGDDVLCAYCGLSFVAIVDEEAKLRLREA